MSIATARHYLNGIDIFEDFGVIVSGGSASFLTMPKRKDTLSYDWPDESGTEHDLETIVFEEKLAVLNCAIKATDIDDFHAKRQAFQQEINKTGWQTWRVEDFDREYQVRFLSEGNARKMTNPFRGVSYAGVIMAFDLSLGVDVDNWILAVRLSVANATAAGGANGSIAASATGGTPPYLYRLNSGAYGTPNLFTGLAAGAYTVRAKDANGLEAQASARITEPQVQSLGLFLGKTNVSVFGGSDGSIVATGTGGSGSFQFRRETTEPWSVAGTSYTFTGLAAGGYTIEMRDAASTGTTVTASTTLTQPAQVLRAFYGWKADKTTLTTTQIQAGTAVDHAAGADITADYRANAQPQFLWFAEKATEPVKTKWYGSADNNGSIGTDQDLFGPYIMVGEWRFYITEYQTQNTQTTIQFRKA